MHKPSLPTPQGPGPQPPWLWIAGAILLLLILMTLLFRRGDDFLTDRAASSYLHTNSLPAGVVTMGRNESFEFIGYI